MPDMVAPRTVQSAGHGTGSADPGDADDTRAGYLSILADAMTRRSRGPSDIVVQRFLTLNAAYFLGDWLPARDHTHLVRRLAGDLDGLANVVVPADPVAAAQLAQHARELTAAFGATPWTDRIVTLTESLVPQWVENWDAPVKEAAVTLSGGALAPSEGSGTRLLLAHARRRMWELAHPPDTGAAAVVPDWALRFARRAAEAGDGRAIQVAEALLAELAYGTGVGASAGRSQL